MPHQVLLSPKIVDSAGGPAGTHFSVSLYNSSSQHDCDIATALCQPHLTESSQQLWGCREGRWAQLKVGMARARGFLIRPGQCLRWEEGAESDRWLRPGCRLSTASRHSPGSSSSPISFWKHSSLHWFTICKRDRPALLPTVRQGCCRSWQMCHCRVFLHKCLLSTSCVQDTVSTLLFHDPLMVTLEGRWCQPHFTDEQAEARRGEVICPQSLN